MNVLVTAATREGSTIEIAEAIATTLRARGFEVTLAAPDAIRDVAPYDAVVVGSAVYDARWLDPAMGFVRRHAGALADRPVWLFSSGPVGGRRRPFARRMAREVADLPTLRRLATPVEHRVFGGKRRRTDWRDWDDIEAWADDIAGSLAHTAWFRRLHAE